MNDKANWGDGPWQAEPDRIEWVDEQTGLDCMMIRNGHMGFWCGYVGVPPGHREHGKHYDDVDVSVHGGLTYSDKCQGHICHTPQPGRPDDVWWLGFDCGHAFDLTPSLAYLIDVLPDVLPRDMLNLRREGEVYRDEAYVREQCRALAEQLA